MAAASTGDDVTSTGCNHAVIRAPPNTAPAVEPMAVANTHCNDDTVAAAESFCFGFTMFLTVPHGAFAVNNSPGQLVVDYHAEPGSPPVRALAPFAAVTTNPACQTSAGCALISACAVGSSRRHQLANARMPVKRGTDGHPEDGGTTDH
jgi:hypothetical protein